VEDTSTPAPTLTVLSLNLRCFKLDGASFGSSDDWLRWEVAFLGWTEGGVAYEWPRDDVAWEPGADHEVAAGALTEVTRA